MIYIYFLIFFFFFKLFLQLIFIAYFGPGIVLNASQVVVVVVFNVFMFFIYF